MYELYTCKCVRCLFLSYERQNGWSDQTKIICNNFVFPIKVFYLIKINISNFQKFCLLISPSLKYRRFTPLGCKDIGNITFELVAKTLFLFLLLRWRQSGHFKNPLFIKATIFEKEAWIALKILVYIYICFVCLLVVFWCVCLCLCRVCLTGCIFISV